MDTMRKRVQAFTEGVVLMVCPVLLAVSLKKADLKSNGNGSLVGGGISLLAAITLEAGLLAVLFLGINDSLPASHGLLLRASKLLVHLCALLLMALAFVILLLIDMDRHMYCLAGLVLAPLVPFTLFRCYRSARDGGDDHAEGGGAATLAPLVDFSAAVTTLLFLGLEGLALEGQSSAACRGMERLFTASLGVTYLTCALGVFVMLVGTVPDPALASTSTDDQGDRSAKARHVAELLNVVLSVAFAVVVVLITAAPLREQAWLVFVPLILSFVAWMYRALVDGDGGLEEMKQAASLELTKVTFTGFLAVAVPTFSNTPVGISTRGFVALSAAAVMSDLGWRLLMTGRMDHNDQRMASTAMVSVANAGSLCAHLCVAAAVLPFATLAVNAVSSSEPGSGCH
uniref:Uncharacterized protein n=1 Tax=Oryza nivara TaxID=4536 RepID=A0A0E0HZ48_ORYNI